MYAIIETGGKQFRVQEGDEIFVEKLPSAAGDTVAFDRVLAVGKDDGLVVGTPVVDGAKVTGTIVKQVKGRKIIVFKYKSKKNYRRKKGHRQPYTQVRIVKIEA